MQLDGIHQLPERRLQWVYVLDETSIIDERTAPEVQGENELQVVSVNVEHRQRKSATWNEASAQGC